MSDYYTATVSVPSPVIGAGIVIPSATVDRKIVTTVTTGSFSFGLSSGSIVIESTNLLQLYFHPYFILPAGEDVWAVQPSNSSASWTIMVTKPGNGSITFTCS